MLFAQPVHPFAVGVLEGLLFAPFELGVTPQAADQKGFEQPAAVELAASGLREGDGVGQRGVERRLVDVDADAGDRAGEGGSRMVVFDQDADQFPVSDVDVVGPLDAGVDAVGGEGVRQGQRHGFGEQELLPDGKEPGFEHHREGEVFTFGAGPRMSPLAASGGLPFGPDDVAVAVFRVAGLVVGRGGFVDTVNHELFILSWVGFSGGRRDQTDTPKSRRASFSEVFLSVDSLRWPMIRAQVMLYSPAGNCLR